MIQLKHPVLRNFRNNLRKILLLSASASLNKAYETSDNLLFSGFNTASTYEHKLIVSLYEKLSRSICCCRHCKEGEKNMVFVDFDEVLCEISYPPIIEKKKDCYWLCEDCYAKMIHKFDVYKEQGYYFFSEYGIIDTLEGLGIKSLDELKKIESFDF